MYFSFPLIATYFAAKQMQEQAVANWAALLTGTPLKSVENK